MEFRNARVSIIQRAFTCIIKGVEQTKFRINPSTDPVNSIAKTDLLKVKKEHNRIESKIDSYQIWLRIYNIQYRKRKMEKL